MLVCRAPAQRLGVSLHGAIVVQVRVFVGNIRVNMVSNHVLRDGNWAVTVGGGKKKTLDALRLDVRGGY